MFRSTPDTVMRTTTLFSLFLLLSSTGATTNNKVEEFNTSTNSTPNGELTNRDTSKGWEQINWLDYKECKVHELCSDDDRQCNSKWTWKDLKKERQATIIDVTNSRRVVIDQINPEEYKLYKESICDLAFLTKGEKSNCTMLRTQNRCKWKPIGCPRRFVWGERSRPGRRGKIPESCARTKNWFCWP